jgi:hypothetical protein
LPTGNPALRAELLGREHGLERIRHGITAGTLLADALSVASEPANGRALLPEQ